MLIMGPYRSNIACIGNLIRSIKFVTPVEISVSTFENVSNYSNRHLCVYQLLVLNSNIFIHRRFLFINILVDIVKINIFYEKCFQQTPVPSVFQLFGLVDPRMNTNLPPADVCSAVRTNNLIITD